MVKVAQRGLGHCWADSFLPIARIVCRRSSLVQCHCAKKLLQRGDFTLNWTQSTRGTRAPSTWH